MKKMIINLAVCLFFCFVWMGCDIHDDIPDFQTDLSHETSSEVVFPFSPSETDILTLYLLKSRIGISEVEYLVQPALTIFQRVFPDVTVVCKEYDEEEYEAIIRTEIPAGKGPDLLITGPNTLPDVQKTMATGLFTDLKPFMESESEEDSVHFIGKTSECGQYLDRQLLLPLEQQIKVLVTTEELLKEEGISQESLDTLPGFLDALTRYRSRHPESNFTCDTGSADPNVLNMRTLLESGGYRMIDYNSKEVLLKAEDIRPMLEVCRLYFIKSAYQFKAVDTMYKTRDCLINRECLFTELNSLDLFMTSTIYLRKSDETPVLVPIPSESGGLVSQIQLYAAIPAGAENELNAWRFLKVLLSEEIQADRTALLGNLPMTEEAAEPYMTQVSVGKGIDTDSSIYKQAVDMILSIDHAQILSPTLWGYFKQQFSPFIQGKKSFETCYDGLVNVLEIYKDE